ncbi:MAG: AbrB family transcriptional regulator, partial [Gemmobacter sp.]|nr:AbrB family transcriptional regulator [Gemmobacter sp.]
MHARLTRIFAGSPPLTVAVTFGLGAAGGAAALALRMPVPMLLGPLLVVAFASAFRLRVAGAIITVPQRWRFALIPVIGVAIGSGVTAQALSEARHWWVTLLGLVVFIPATHALAYMIYRRFGGLDKPTAYHAAIPGGLIESV